MSVDALRKECFNLSPKHISHILKYIYVLPSHFHTCVWSDLSPCHVAIVVLCILSDAYSAHLRGSLSSEIIAFNLLRRFYEWGVGGG